MNARPALLNLLASAALLAGLWLSPAPLRAEEPSVTARIETDRPEPYEREPFTLTLSIEAKGVQLSQAMELTPGPEAEALKLEAFQELPGEQVPKDGTVITRKRFRCRAAGVRAGPVRVAPVLQVRLLFRRSAFIGSFWEERPASISVQPLDLQVLPVPSEGRPAHWSGAIGRFDFQADAAPREIAPGELVKVRMTIAGKGYTADLKPPRLDAGDGFRVYEPTAVPAAEGRLEFDQVVVPLGTNTPAVPAVSFCFFDTGAGRYATVTRGPFPLRFRARQAVTADVYRPASGPTRGVEALAHAPRERLGKAIPPALTVLAALAAMAAVQGCVRRRWLLATAGLVAGLACGAGAVAMRRYATGTEPGLAILRDVPARIAPSEAARESFPLARGAAVRISEQAADGWVCVRHGADAGWVPADAVGRAAPEK